MEFKFHLYVQNHLNGTFTVTPLPFFDMAVFGSSLEDVKTEIREALIARVQDMNPSRLHQFEFNPRLRLISTQVEVRPVDKKKRSKRREKVQLQFALLVEPQDDGQLFVRVPRLGYNSPSFYVYNRAELQVQSGVELQAWLEGSTLDELQEHTPGGRETLDVLEIEVPLKKLKKREEQKNEWFNPFGAEEEPYSALKETGINLTTQVKESRSLRVYRREQVISDLMHILEAPRNNSVLLVGPSESGKTAVVRELVRRLEREDCPEILKNRTVWQLSPDRIIAGAQFIGTWEERINNIVDECRKMRHILYIDDLPGLLEIGRWSKSDSNVALVLRPHIASGDLVIIGEGLPERVAMGDSIGPSFMNLFRRVPLPSLGEDESAGMLRNVSRDLEREQRVRILPEAGDTVIQLARRFLPYRAFPGKAIRLLEETISASLRDLARRKKPPQEGGSLLRRLETRTSIDRGAVISTFAQVSGLPEFIINDAARLNIGDCETFFRERIIGQPQAIDTVINLVTTVKAGLNDPEKPLGTLMFIGPTGVGKTQMAKTLAEYLFGSEDRLLRFDMSEYRDLDGVARLIGAFGKDGELTRKVREQPFCVILLDEFEKADPRIYDIFLQVLGEGRISDAAGKTSYFHNTIIIMTSNLGSGARSFSGLGFNYGDEVSQSAVVGEALQEHYRQQVHDYFRPEFVNRIDQVVVFGQLDDAALRSIAGRELGEILLRDGVTRRNLAIEIEDSVIDLVLKTGYSPQYGARPLKREIERLVVAPMARELAQRSVSDSSLLRVGVEQDTYQLAIRMISIEESESENPVILATGWADFGLRRDRKTTPELVEGFATLRRKMADWIESDYYQSMQQQKLAILEQSNAADFWNDADEARFKIVRFNSVDRLVERIRELYDRAIYLEDLTLIIDKERDTRYQAELARDYDVLYRDVSCLDIETATAHLPHRNQAMLLFRPVGMKTGALQEPSQQWIRRLVSVYLRMSERKGYHHDLFLLSSNLQAIGEQVFTKVVAGSFQDLLRRFREAGPAEEVALFVEGPNVFGFLKGERGIHHLLNVGDEQMVNVQVFAIPDETNVSHWLRDYQVIKNDINEGRRAAPPEEKLSVVRQYSLEEGAERFVRDTRTNIRTNQIKSVLERGELDEFILAFIQQEPQTNSWEDRYPPVFPFDVGDMTSHRSRSERRAGRGALPQWLDTRTDEDDAARARGRKKKDNS